jgi:hypothetical protein
MSESASLTALWRFVWDSAKSNPSTLLALISAITALTVAIVTPLVSFYTTARQIRATIVSANRQVWINALRDDLAELFGLLTGQFSLKSVTQIKDETERKYRVAFLSYRIVLRLNPDEPHSQTLKGSIEKLHLLYADSGHADNDNLFSAALACAVSTSQKILKTEWKRVKKGH